MVKTSGGNLIEQAPIVYQDVAGGKHFISDSTCQAGNRVGFQLAAYDPDLAACDRSDLLSGLLNLPGRQRGSQRKLHRRRSLWRRLRDGNRLRGLPLPKHVFPRQVLWNSLPARYAGNGDVFVSKLNASGTGLVYSTYLGGSGSDWAKGIAVDRGGNAYITGNTISPNFPTKNAYQSQIGYGSNGNPVITAFVAELNATGSAISTPHLGAA